MYEYVREVKQTKNANARSIIKLNFRSRVSKKLV